MERLWEEVDDYFTQHLAPADDALTEALAASTAANMPPISVTPTQGKLLHLLARMIGARRILEIGTLGGYSTIWLARALPADGRLVTLEINPTYATLAQQNLSRAGLSDRVQVLVAPAAESLRTLAEERVEPFDLVFIDADKASGDQYFLASLALSHHGTVIVVDNVVRKGAVVDSETTDADLLGIRRLTELLSRERRVSATVVQTVGAKGYDGFILARVTTDAGSP
ncbi:MAG TPA: O-methyltransferase [Gemmatimonadaceae bacterium]|nr:O-methyltransferase [Gemmatimonadaceae bacterium]